MRAIEWLVANPCDTSNANARPLIHTTLNTHLQEYMRATEWLVANQARLKLPLLLFHSEGDTQTDPEGTKRLYEQAQVGHCTACTAAQSMPFTPNAQLLPQLLADERYLCLLHACPGLGWAGCARCNAVGLWRVAYGMGAARAVTVRSCTVLQHEQGVVSSSAWGNG